MPNLPETTERFNLEVYVTKFDNLGTELATWTVETYDFASLTDVAGALRNVGNLLESNDLEPDRFDGVDYSLEYDYDWYDDNTQSSDDDAADPYE